MEDEPQFGEALPGRSYVERPGAYALITRDDCLLVVETPSGYFLPGGGVDVDERLEDALDRELREEVGLSVEWMTALATARQYIVDAQTDVAYNKIEHFFHVIPGTGSVGPVERDYSVRWVTVEEALARLREPAQAWAVEVAFRWT